MLINNDIDAFIRTIHENDDLASNDIELVESLIPLVAPNIANAICAALEICPIHMQRDEICADDELADCAHLR